MFSMEAEIITSDHARLVPPPNPFKFSGYVAGIEEEISRWALDAPLGRGPNLMNNKSRLKELR